METAPVSWRHVATTGAVAVLGTIWYFWWAHTGAGPAAIGYLFMPIGSVAAAIAIRAARADPRARDTPHSKPNRAGSLKDGGLAPVAGSFWRLLQISCLLVAAGYGVLAVAAMVSAPELPNMPLVAAALAGAGVVTAMWAVARLPLGITSWHQRGKQALDRTIAFLGCATLLWHFGLSPMLTSPDPWTPAGLALMVLACVFAVGAVTKVSYITGGPVDRTAARLIASVGLVAAAVAVPAVTLGGDGAVAAQAVCMPLAPVLVALGARRQQVSAGAAPRRGNVWLPYLAVLAVDLPLIHAVLAPPWFFRPPGAGPWAAGDRIFETRLVVAAAVLVTGLVTVRQYLAFRENSRLLAEQRESERRLRYEVTHDLLTGLANRALFRRRLDEALGGAPDGTPSEVLAEPADDREKNGNGGPRDGGLESDGAGRRGDVTVLLVDLDDFKAVNDSLGHDVGDELLVAFAAQLRQAVGDAGEVARLAGDEFAILIDEARAEQDAPTTQQEMAGSGEGTGPGERIGAGERAGSGERLGEQIAGRVMAAAAAPISGHRLLVHVSAGLATAPPGTPASLLLRAADTAMHAAKGRGKGNWVRYTAGMERPAEATAQLGGDLRRALDAGEFRLVYQPIVGLADGRIAGVEALVRWQHPERGTVPPIDFIPAAERTGLIVPLGRFVLRETCRQGAIWLDEFGPEMLGKIAPNVSVRQLHDPDFVADVRAALDESGLPADRLVLELTESGVLRGAQVSRVLHEVHAMGVRLALDDFGTGESSLSLLRAFPASIVKLDKSFVDGIELDEPGTASADARQAVARAVVQLAAAFKLDTVAEGIENQEQVDRLLRLGYTVGQGFHLGRPATPEEITARFAAERATSAAA